MCSFFVPERYVRLYPQRLQRRLGRSPTLKHIKARVKNGQQSHLVYGSDNERSQPGAALTRFDLVVAFIFRRLRQGIPIIQRDNGIQTRRFPAKPTTIRVLRSQLIGR